MGSLNKKDGLLAAGNEKKAKMLNKFFASVLTQEERNINMLKNLYSRGSFLGNIIVTPIAVQEKLRNLNLYKSQGLDLIPPRILKDESAELAVPLCSLFNVIIFGIITR